MSYRSELIQKVEQLLLRHEELVRTNVLLEKKMGHLVQERDLLQKKLTVASNRIDALISQIPESKKND